MLSSTPCVAWWRRRWKAVPTGCRSAWCTSPAFSPHDASWSRRSAWSAIPAGALVGGAIVKVSGHVDLVYAGIGLLNIAIAAFFRFFTALGDAQRYVDERKVDEERVAAEAAAAV